MTKPPLTGTLLNAGQASSNINCIYQPCILPLAVCFFIFLVKLNCLGKFVFPYYINFLYLKLVFLNL